MSTMLPSVKGKSWVFQVTALCLVLGALLGLSLKTQKQVVNEGLPGRPLALKQAYREIQRENEKLRKDVADFKDRSDQLQEQLVNGGHSSEILKKTLDEAKVLAGTTAVRGPGIIVTLVDSPKMNLTETNRDLIEDYLVHEEDLTKVVFELFNAGAEAVSLNGQRWVATSYIRCVGSVVMMGSVRIAPPYVIEAIGSADDLEYAIKTPGGPAADLFLSDMITVKKAAVLKVPAYKGGTRINFAVPVEENKSE